MSFDLHTVSVIGGAPAKSDRLDVGLYPGQPTAAGGGAGQSVSFNVTGRFPKNYMVFFGGFSQDAVASISNKTQTGFTVTVSPRLAANTLVAGIVDILVVG